MLWKIGQDLKRSGVPMSYEREGERIEMERKGT